MVLRHKAPIARVERVVAIVAHHPIVVHFECIACGRLIVDVDNAILHLERVALIILDASGIDGQIVDIEANLLALLRNPHLAIVGTSPAIAVFYRIRIKHLGSRFFHHLHYPRIIGGNLSLHILGERSVIDGRNRAVGTHIHAHQSHTLNVLYRDLHLAAVGNAHAEVVPHIVGDGAAIGLQEVVELHIVRIFDRFAVDIHHIIHYLQSVAGQTYATLHIVFAAVDGAINNVAVLSLIAMHLLAAVKVNESIIVGVLHLQSHSVAGREVKHHNIVTLYVAQAFKAMIIPLWLIDVALAVENRQSVLRQREV